MTKNTSKVNGGAMPKLDRAVIMLRAWVIFRSAYSDCPKALTRNRRKASFGYCLMLAWRGEKAGVAAKLAAKDAVVDRLAHLRGSIEIEHMSENWRAARVTIATMRTELASLT